MFIYLNKRGQSTLEYGVIIAVIVGALIIMQVYIKRGVQGRLRQATDDIGEAFSPGATTYTHTTNSTVNSTEYITPTQWSTGEWVSDTQTLSNQIQNRVVNENISDFNAELWPQ